ncbi:hypothetical protein [Sinomonas sp. G460-2]|uniref:hypothetical protein n=1 Tax=Sinomonas sp. G460-2 TaxID=3393464 RepID=UPI0039EEE695
MRILEQVAAASAQDVPQWWQIVSSFAPVGTFATAVVAAIVGLWTLRQRAQADRRAEFWRRTEWALEATVSADPQMQAIGTELLATLARSELVASDEELMFLDAVWLEPIAEAAEAYLDDELGLEDDPDHTGGDGPAVGPEEAEER